MVARYIFLEKWLILYMNYNINRHVRQETAAQLFLSSMEASSQDSKSTKVMLISALNQGPKQSSRTERRIFKQRFGEGPDPVHKFWPTTGFPRPCLQSGPQFLPIFAAGFMLDPLSSKAYYSQIFWSWLVHISNKGDNLSGEDEDKYDRCKKMMLEFRRGLQISTYRDLINFKTRDYPAP